MFQNFEVKTAILHSNVSPFSIGFLSAVLWFEIDFTWMIFLTNFALDSAVTEYSLSKPILAHSPPVITTKSTWIALVEQQFHLQLDASDPENQTVTFHLKENYEGVTLSRSGLLKWLPNEPGMNLFTVIARDRCGKDSTLSLSINVTQCSCNERENCQLVRNSSGEFIICLCPDGCTGPM